MYVPSKYQADAPDEVWNFIRAHPFALLVSHDGQKPVATHLPLLLRQEGNQYTLIGHISRANLQKEQLADKQEKLAVFQGPHAYVSSSWYQVEEVPTWNYISVHCYGSTRILDDATLRTELHELVRHFEADQLQPFRLEEMAQKKVDREMRGIIGFKMQIHRLEAAFKLSQNRSDADHERIIMHLQEQADTSAQAVAEAMKKQRP